MTGTAPISEHFLSPGQAGTRLTCGTGAGKGPFLYRRPCVSWKPVEDLCYIPPMERDEAINRLKKHEAELRQLGVEHLYLFGSTARGDASDMSDVDLFFDHEKGQLGLFELMDVKERAASILGRKADVMTRDSLHPVLKKRIEEYAVLVF
jgi:predicted nucleotidyltransferase